MKPLLKISDFKWGIVDAFSRGAAPPGSLADAQNLVPKLIGGLRTPHGFTTTGGLASLPTAFRIPTAGSKSDFIIASQQADPFPFSLEKPAAHDGHIMFFKDNQGTPVYHVAVKPHYMGNSGNDPLTAASPALNVHTEVGGDYANNAGFVLLDEHKIFTGAGVASAGVAIVVTDGPATYGLSATNDYYNGWIIEWVDDSEGETEYAYIVDYSVGGGDSTFTVKEDLDAAGAKYHMAWSNGDATAGDTFTVRRWFHHGNFGPDYSTPPGQCFAAGQAIRGCGGAESDADKVPWHLHYLDKVFFPNVASEACNYTGTYVDQMECDPNGRDAVITSGAQGVATRTVHLVNVTTNEATYPLDEGDYQLAWSLEYDGFQESALVEANFGTTDDATAMAAYQVFLTWAVLNKRVTAVNVYCRHKPSASSVWTEYYHIRRHDIVTQTSDNPEATADSWGWETTYEGDFELSDTINGSHWSLRGQTYYQRTNRTVGPVTERNIASWLYTVGVGGRQFFSPVYDLVDGALYPDQIRFSPRSSNGTVATDIISPDILNFALSVGYGDPSSVNGLAYEDSYLIALKDKGVHSFMIGPQPHLWVENKLSTVDGCSSPKSVVQLPEGGVGFADVDHYKLLRGQRILPLTHSIADTYFAFSNKATIIAWYDKIDRSLRITDGVDATTELSWVCYLDRPFQIEQGRIGFPWFKTKFPDGHHVQFRAMERDGSIIFCNSTTAKAWVFHQTDRYWDATNSIVPTFKTSPIVPDESKVMVLDRVMIVKSGDGNGGTLDCDLYLDAVAQAFDSLTRTWKHLMLKIKTASIKKGHSLAVAYNTNAAGEYKGNGVLDVYEIVVYGELREAANINKTI